MKLQMMVILLVVVLAALVTAAPFYQPKKPHCKVGQVWPYEDGCNTCTCQADGQSYACTRGRCDPLQQQVDLGIVDSNNKDDALQQVVDLIIVKDDNLNNEPLQERSDIQSKYQDDIRGQELQSNNQDDHGEWIPFDIKGHMLNGEWIPFDIDGHVLTNWA